MADPTTILLLINALIVGAVLAHGAWQDLRTHRFPHRNWLGPAIVLTPLTIAASVYITYGGHPEHLLLSWAVGALLFYGGVVHIYGGADAVALTAIALAVPVHPLTHESLFILPVLVAACIIAIAAVVVKGIAGRGMVYRIPFLPSLLAGFVVVLLAPVV